LRRAIHEKRFAELVVPLIRAAMPNRITRREKEISVSCAGAMRDIVTELADVFMLNSGSSVSFTFDRSGVVKNKVLDGDRVDVAITTEAAVDELVRRRKVEPDGGAVVARSKIGVAIRSGTVKPDIGSVESFKRLLLDAKSVVCADPATGSPSGNHFMALLSRLGIAADIEPKLSLVGAGQGSIVVVCEAVAGGRAEIGIQQIAEILPVPGVDLAGPLPEALQQITVFAAAVGASVRELELARRFIAFIASPAAAPVVIAHGMEPPLG
jgi:molybdate transport system substrate-binding protein